MQVRTRTVCWSAVVGTLALGGALVALAGPLSPPGGPVASTGKTLTEVEPRIAVNATNTPGTATSLFKITQPGSYYLTGNITGVSGKNGIEIAASGVSLDLTGFDLSGVPGSLDGVNWSAGSTNVSPPPSARSRSGRSRVFRRASSTAGTTTAASSSNTRMVTPVKCRNTDGDFRRLASRATIGGTQNRELIHDILRTTPIVNEV